LNNAFLVQQQAEDRSTNFKQMESLGASIGDIASLSSLLEQSREAEGAVLSSNRQHAQPPMATGQTVVRTGAASSVSAAAAASAPTNKKKAETSIWAIDDVPLEDALIGVTDDRPCPRHEFCYKQQVGTEDTFLGLGDKSPASSSCSHLVIKVHFPGSTMKDLDLDVTKNRIKAESKTHKLFTYLPVTVNSEKGKAQFDKQKELLTVTLPIVNEWDKDEA